MQAPTDLRVMFIDCAPFSGGAQRSFTELIAAARERGVVPYVLAADDSPGGVLESCARQGLRCRALQSHHWRRTAAGMVMFLVDRLRWRSAVAGALREARPALVHANGIRTGLLVDRMIPPEIPLLLHDRDVRGPAAVLERLARRIDRVIAISEVVSRRWEGVLDAERVRVIHNGLPVDRIGKAVPTTLWPEAASAFSVVLVGDLVPWKGHARFLEAVSRLQRDAGAGNIRAAVIGRGRGRHGRAYSRELAGLARRLGLTDTVLFRADVTDALPWIAAADVAVSAAEQEPFGRTVVEALALGKPVVAVRGGGPDEILRDCPAGTLVEADAGALAAGLRHWRDPEKRVAAAEPARRRARAFDLAVMVRQVCAFYGEMVSPSQAD